MMDKMIFGRYVPADSVVHRMDPRSKLTIIFLFVCVIFLANGNDVWEPLAQAGRTYRYCANAGYGVCNWMTPAEDPQAILPGLSAQPGDSESR